jgi:hypothetical protein
MWLRTKSFHLLLPAALLSAVAGCASVTQTQQASNAVGLECPAGHTLTCETRTTGRIHHGSFGKDNDRCACVSADHKPMVSPAIPSIHR